MPQSGFILGCSVRLLHHTELPGTFQGDIRTVPSTGCPCCGLLLPLQQPGWDCTGVHLQKPSCPSPSEPRDPPATLGCHQEPRPAFDSPQIMEILCSYDRPCVRGQSVTLLLLHPRERLRKMLEIQTSPSAGTETPHKHTKVHVPEKTRASRASLFLPQSYLSPSFASTNAEMGIFRELIFRMIHSQKERMKQTPAKYFSF